jgi:hypothetical protein
MSDRVNDGSVQFGSRSLTINGTDYATDDFSFETASSEVLRTSEFEVLSGRVSFKGATTGSATLQLASSSTVIPAFGAQFTEDVGLDTSVWTVTNVGRTESKGGETKVPISFVLNITTDIVAS